MSSVRMTAMTSSAARLSPCHAILLIACASALTACQTDSGGPAAEAAAPQVPRTHSEAALECWMSLEKGKGKDLSLDKRADIVTKCIKDKMNPGAQPAAATPKASGKPPKSKT